MELFQLLIQETNYHLNQAQVEVNLAKQTTRILPVPPPTQLNTPTHDPQSHVVGLGYVQKRIALSLENCPAV
ncbi:hypothetical protein AAFF_G00142560 [Aldrovandia affinis]|uniref:Uncharacterized protein n=1 Tax=Aldrovandia affinis TaxID=143900 RepID=A0AAD7WXM1_9TELE|nr:hypothetical protein AAFF_G00142560 [Aldrovandia affinis]